MKNVLLPRSTGLHYSLRSLAPRIPDLRLLDITLLYPGMCCFITRNTSHHSLLTHLPGIPPLKYGQDYYTLRSIFFNGIPPPRIHMHLRVFDVKDGVPIGDLTKVSKSTTPDPKNKHTVEVDIPVEEKDVFDVWLRKLWQEKDVSMDRFYEHGSFSDKKSDTPSIEIPLKLKSKREILDAFCFFWPASVAYLWGIIRG